MATAGGATVAVPRARAVTLVPASAEFAAQHQHCRKICRDPALVWRTPGASVVVAARDAEALHTQSHAFTLADDCECGVSGCTCTQAPGAARTPVPHRRWLKVVKPALVTLPTACTGASKHARRNVVREGFANVTLSAAGQALATARPTDTTLLATVNRVCLCGALVIVETVTVAQLAAQQYMFTLKKFGRTHGAACIAARAKRRLTVSQIGRMKDSAADHTTRASDLSRNPSVGFGLPQSALKNMLAHERRRRMGHAPHFEAVHVRLEDMLGRYVEANAIEECNVLMYNPPSDVLAQDYDHGSFTVLVELPGAQANMAKHARRGLVAHDDKVGLTPDGLALTVVRRWRARAASCQRCASTTAPAPAPRNRAMAHSGVHRRSRWHGPVAAHV